MSWPRNTDYNEAIQNLRSTVSDEELRQGQPALNALGLPSPYSGNFADVYKVHCPKTGNTWAVKCFTREVVGLGDRYREISAHLNRKKLGFMVDFEYVEPGIRAAGGWHPFLKMRWVEGQNLNQFVGEYLDRPKMLKQLLGLWVKLSARLRAAEVAHADLQHGNVLLVSAGERGQLGLKLIDYDGMYVPALFGKRSGESGHPAFQHPQRLRERIFGAEVDRFPHLAIYTAIHCLTLERRALWKDFDSSDNLLFRESDFADPGRSKLFCRLWALPDANAHALVGRLILACRMPLDQVPLLEQVVDNDDVRPLSREEARQANAAMDGAIHAFPPIVPGVSLPMADRLSPLLVPGPVSEQSAGGAAGEPPWWNASLQDSVSAPLRPATRTASASPSKYLAARWRAAWRRIFRTKEARTLVPYAIMAAILCVVFIVLFLSMRGGRHPQNQPTDSMASKPPELAVAPFDATQAKAHQERWAKSLNVPSGETNTIGMKLALIPAGEFMMGSPASEGESDEHPQHRVRITKPFWLGIHEVTVGQFRQFAVDTKHSNTEWQTAFPGQTDEHPAVKVSWEDANAFLKWLSAKEGKAYRLPTEAEWECACRAGTTTKYSFGDDENQLGEYAWYDKNSSSTTHPVGGKNPNAWGLYDMEGNVWEWCADWYESGYYAQFANGVATDPTGPPQAVNRVLRGGCWLLSGRFCRPADRSGSDPGNRLKFLGFRLAL